MKPSELLIDAFDRIGGSVAHTLKDLDSEALNRRPAQAGNSISWLVWHLSRVMDDHVSEVAGVAQVWTEQGFVQRFALPLEPADTGYGHTSAQVSDVRVPDEQLLLDYHQAVQEQSAKYLRTLTEPDLDRVVDEAWDPAVTLGVRLVSVIGDCLMHAGQAAYVRGLPDHNE